MKGYDVLLKHVPELNKRSGKYKFAGIGFGAFALTTAYFIITDQIPTWTIDSQIVVMALGFLLVSRLFTRKKALIEKFKDMAYSYAFGRFALPGLAVIFAAIVHIAYMNGPKFTQPTFVTISTVLGWYLLIVGALLWIRSAFTIGLDHLAMLYVYFPEEGGMKNTNIYGVLRHPVYAGALRVCIGLALLNTGIYALSFAILLPLGFTGWIRLVEEKELIERFGGSYLDYRRRIPAFWSRFRDIGHFFTFLFTGR
ncbi:MAG TPA: methyltransferase [Anaerolineales bacterium]|nr:methyltransferase [Anaerolineales bacterium]